MSLRIHICRDTIDADRIIDAKKILLKNPNLNATKLTEPEIIIYDYSDDPNNPTQLNQNKVCVIINN